MIPRPHLRNSFIKYFFISNDGFHNGNFPRPPTYITFINIISLASSVVYLIHERTSQEKLVCVLNLHVLSLHVSIITNPSYRLILVLLFYRFNDACQCTHLPTGQPLSSGTPLSAFSLSPSLPVSSRHSRSLLALSSPLCVFVSYSFPF